MERHMQVEAAVMLLFVRSEVQLKVFPVPDTRPRVSPLSVLESNVPVTDKPSLDSTIDDKTGAAGISAALVTSTDTVTVSMASTPTTLIRT